MILMATKSHENPTANGTFKAPVGARNMLLCLANYFCDFLWQKLLGISAEKIGKASYA
jgi:hypothetical protein